MIIEYFLITASLFNFILGLAVVFADYKNRVNQAFSALCFLFALWVFLNYLLHLDANFLILAAVYALGPILVTTAILWVRTLGSRIISSDFILFIALFYLLDVVVALFIFLTSFVIKDVTSQFQYQLGELFYLYAIYITGAFICFSIYLIYVYKHAESILKKQLKSIAFGLLLMVLVGALVSVILPLFGYTALNFLDSPSSVIFVLLAASAILKYEAFNVRIAATGLFVVLLWAILLANIIVEKGTIGQKSIDLVVFAASVALGVLLVRAAVKEDRHRRQLQLLTRELQRANDKLKVVDAMKTEFVSIASHELLTPISAIEGYLSMMLEEKMVKIKDPKAIDYMNRVFQSAKRLARLVTGLLNVSRIEEGRLLVEKSDVHLADIVKTAAGEIKIKAAKEKISLSLDGIEGSKVKLYADGDKIKEVLLNLCSNAVKYNKPGGSVKIAMEYWPKSKVAAAEGRTSSQMEKDEEGDGLVGSVVHEKYREIVGGKQLVISVKDTGIGMDKKDISHLFKKFSRVGDWSTQRTQGTGLGLYISKALVELHHGRMWVESRGRGKGSTFYFSLPTIEAKESVVKLDGQAPKTRNAKPLAKGGLSGG